jgi:hypothetical protein
MLSAGTVNQFRWSYAFTIYVNVFCWNEKAPKPSRPNPLEWAVVGVGGGMKRILLDRRVGLR